MHSSVRRICSIGAMLFLVLGFASSARAVTSTFNGKSWQTGDIIVCFGTGTCNVMRIVGGSAVLLDQISSGLLGATGGVGINNTLHVLVTDNGAESGHTSNVVMYSIASVDPFTGANIMHTPLQVFDGSNGGAASNAQAVAVNRAGHMFVASAGSGNPPPATIVELDAHGGFVGSHAVPNGCIDTQLASIDLSADGSSVYLTSKGGTIQNFSLTSNICTPFANLGPAVTFNGIRDIPGGALAGVTPNCNGTTCPGGETVLVVAKGFFDSDGDPGVEPGGVPDQADDVNICTNLLNSPLVSCALLLDTGGPGLTAPAWIASNPYSMGLMVLDANLHVQQVATPGTSGTYAVTPFHPAWNTSGGNTFDGLTWTNRGRPAWAPNTPYQANAVVVDSNFNIEQATNAGTSGPADSVLTGQPMGGWNATVGGNTSDGGVTWVNLGTPVWVAGTSYSLAQPIFDGPESNNVQQVTTAGISGPSTHPVWNSTIGGLTYDNAVKWLDLGTSVVARYPVTGVNTLQALALDPLTANCTGNVCTSTPLPARTLSNFWLADNGSSNFYKLDFATGASGTPLPLDASLNCAGCAFPVSSIQGIGVYGGEGANQPGLARLLAPSSIDNTNPPTSNTKSASFLDNSEVVTVYGLAGPVNLALYASLVDPVSCFNDQNAALSCRVTTSVANGAKPIVWKIDIPQGTADLTNLSSASIAAKYTSTVSGAIDNGTDAFTDMFYDTTVLVGNTDPGQFTKPSVQSLHEVPFTATGGAACAFSSPVDNTCYKSNRTTLPFTIPLCSGMSIADFSTLGLTAPAGGLSLVQTFGASQAFLPVDLSGTTGGATNRKASFRYDSSKNQWVYQLALSTLSNQGRIPGTFTGCAFDSTHKAQTFCVRNIKIQKSCP